MRPFDTRCSFRIVASVGHTVVESERGVVPHAMTARGEAGQDRGMGRERHRHVRERARVSNPFRCEPIERRRQALAIPERADAILPQRVDRDEQDIGAARLAGSQGRLSAAATAHQRHRPQDRETGRSVARRSTSHHSTL
jgi:hypothetical protein